MAKFVIAASSMFWFYIIIEIGCSSIVSIDIVSGRERPRGRFDGLEVISIYV